MVTKKELILLVLITLFCVGEALKQIWGTEKLSKITLLDLERQEKAAIASHINDGYKNLKQSRQLFSLAQNETKRLALLGKLSHPKFSFNSSIYGYS
jgi:hypothetical protein